MYQVFCRMGNTRNWQQASKLSDRMS